MGAYKNSILQAQLENDKSQIETANKDLANFDNLQKEALFLNDRNQLATQIENARPVWSQILESLINSVPSDVQFKSLIADVAKSPNFILQGNTTSEREAIKFKEKLENSPFFKDVAFKSSSVSSGEDTNTLDFTLEFNLEQNVAKQSSAKGTQ